MKLQQSLVQAIGLAQLVLASPTPGLLDAAPDMAEITKRHCGNASWDSTNLANWGAANTDQWFSSWWGLHLGGNGPDTSAVIPHNWPNDFANLFGRMYLNGKENYECSKVDNQCYGDVSCDDVQCFERWGPECDTFDAKRPIYFVMTSLQTFQDYFKDYINVLDETQIDFLGMSAYLTNNFFPKPDQANALFLKEFFNALAAVFSITGSYAKLIPIIAGNNIAKETSGAVGALLGGIGNGYRETVHYPSDPSFDNLANLNRFMTNVFESARTTLQNMQANLAPGKQWQGKYFKDIAAGGALLPGRGSSTFNPGSNISPDVLLRQYLSKQFNARAINYIWRKEKIFITYTTDVDGSCQQDKQGPQDMKYCRANDPGVYYMYWWHQKSVGAGTTLGIDSFDTGKMDHPTGFDKLTAIWIDAGYNLALEDIFEASIAAWQVAGPDYDGQVAINRAQDAVSENWAHPWDHDTKWEGTFTIPVCNTGNLSYNVQLGDRIMPCNCGGDGSQVQGFRNNSNMLGYGVYDQQCTPGMQAARQQTRHGGAGNNPTTTPSLPTDVNKIACLGSDGPTADMAANIQDCQEAIAALGTDMNKQICSSSCSDSGHQDATQWCRVALDKSNIHNCALTLAAKDKEHGGPDSTCASVGDLNKFLVNAQATTDNGGAGCHKVGTVDFAATFMPPDGMSRWCLSSYKHPEWCTV